MASLALILGGDTSHEAVVGGVERAPASEYPVIFSCSGDKLILPAAPHRGRDGRGRGPATELEAKIKHTRELDVPAWRGWNHFCVGSEGRGLGCNPL